jgi:glycerol-3-phosphate dehydrogenase
VVLNARDAGDRGARILTRARVVSAERGADRWLVLVRHADGREETFAAKAVVNAGGPWVEEVLKVTLGQPSAEGIRLVRGSHIVTRRLFDHDRCYFFQGEDGRIIFAIPYEGDFTLIGTTDKDHHGDPAHPVCTEEEAEYLCAFASKYFRRPVTRADVVWTYSGVRPLYNDGARSATAATRDYVLSLDDRAAPLLSVFGGKITTYRRLAEHALDKLRPFFPGLAGNWTARVPLPGGAFPVDGAPGLIADLRARHPFLTDFWATRLVRAYGTEAATILGEARSAADLGRDFGATLTEAELRWLITREFARTAEDVLWRRTKLGLRMAPEAAAMLDDFMTRTDRALREVV